MKLDLTSRFKCGQDVTPVQITWLSLCIVNFTEYPVLELRRGKWSLPEGENPKTQQLDGGVQAGRAPSQ